MILRKPYAFLIKNFKIIHLVLLVLSIYINYRTNIISTFFRNYVSNNYSAVITNNFSETFINIPIILALIIMILSLVAIIYLLVYKKKKQKFYYIAVVYNIILLIILFFYLVVFNTLETGVISADSARFYRDLALIIYIPQFAFIVFFGIRALGFNVKQFNFKQDLKELELNKGDNEEVEVNINFETYKAKRSFRRLLRETGYYVKENLFMVIIVSILTIIIIVYLILSNTVNFENTKINLKQTFNYNTLSYTINDTYLTNIDLGGNIINKDRYYIAIQIEIENTSIYDVTIDSNDFKIHYGNEILVPKIGLSSYFLDYGKDLINPIINHYSKNTYVLVYEINEADINKNFELRLYKGPVIQNEISYPTYYILNINQNIIKNNVTGENKNLTEEMNFNLSNVNNSTLMVNDYTITNRYSYEAEKCDNDKCTNYTDVISLNTFGDDYNKTLLILEGNISLDNSSIYYKNNNTEEEFINNFINVEYIINDTIKFDDIEAISVDNNDNIIAMKVPKEIVNASEIVLNIKIRNYNYEYAIKN